VTALVLSAGGMYGAYQAGAWKELADVFRPDLVVGASIGALTGWAIAGGCEPEELIARWLHLEGASNYRWKIPRRLSQGVLDTAPLRCVIRNLHDSFRPKIGYGVVLTDLFQLRPRVFRGSEVTWLHLAASTAVAGLFDQVRIDGRLYTDGGLLASVPLWAAVELGATRALVIDVLPEPPGLVAKTFVSGMRRLSRFREPVHWDLEVIRLTPTRLLGSPWEAIAWSRRNAERWIEAGQRDAAAMKHSIENCFERQ